ncbi:hypothetical protein QWA68_008177 [Fusarium oxysporum]|nr:hypothetical protein QWA68_008177 [Fusarium oxysporum]
MSDLQVKEDTLIMARNSVNQTFDTEDISPATDHFSSSTGDLSSPNGMGRREAITTRAQAIECSSECHPGITKGTFQQLNHEISDEVNGAEVDIEQRQQPLEKAGHIVNGPNCMRHANEALAGMLNQRNNRLSWVAYSPVHRQLLLAVVSDNPLASFAQDPDPKSRCSEKLNFFLFLHPSPFFTLAHQTTPRHHNSTRLVHKTKAFIILPSSSIIDGAKAPAGSSAPRSLAPAPPSAPAQSGGIKARARSTGSTITSTGKQRRQPATSNQGLSPSTITPSGIIVYADFVSTGNPAHPRAQQTPQADVSPNNRSLEEQYHLFFQKPSRAAVLEIHQSSKTRLRISAVPIQDVTDQHDQPCQFQEVSFDSLSVEQALEEGEIIWLIQITLSPQKTRELVKLLEGMNGLPTIIQSCSFTAFAPSFS